MKGPAMLLWAVVGCCATPLRAAQAPIDAELLEFLGSIGEEEDWQEYLEQKPVKIADGKIAKTTPVTPVKAPVSTSDDAAPREKDK